MEGAVNTNHNKNLKEWCYDKAWLNHYFTKSWEDWCHRIFKRGDTSPGHRLKNNYKENKNTKIIITDTWHYNFVNFIKEYDK